MPAKVRVQSVPPPASIRTTKRAPEPASVPEDAVPPTAANPPSAVGQISFKVAEPFPENVDFQRYSGG